jgi:hypothetical protein
MSQRKRWRGVVLEIVYDGHQKQESRLDDLVLWGMMRDLGHDVGQSEVLTLLQYLQAAKYLTFKQDRDKITNVVRISQIEITPEGCALVEKERTDPMVHVLL